MRPLLFELGAAPGLGARLAELLPAEIGKLDRRQFPDGETYLRFETPAVERDVLLLSTLDRPDPKLTPLLFAASAAREQGARSVGLAAPYLAYMRQDKAFEPGEAVTSTIFARLLSGHFDWLVTIDPHLHRYLSLDAIYSVPAIAGTASEAIARWIRHNVDQPVIIGPDEESRQWVERIASLAGARWTVFKKRRGGDYSVRIDDEGLGQLGNGTPVLVDDIASTARTLIEAVKLIESHGREAPICVVVHPIFAGDSYRRLLGLARVVSTNTIAHESNVIDISEPLADAIRAALGAPVGRSMAGP
jgi:ribose-phosphate pyrophosphokinase